MTKHINTMIVIYDNMKTDAELQEIVNEMNGKNKKEVEEILVREGILVPVKKVRTEFNITYTKKSLWERLKSVLKKGEN